ncbi:hypothetical protein P7K49_020495 [Saguinus oedipus]|uniref:Uncharacterized protein n=1 Tax=Saguinus oedipus TaxID=9490 RepID=A0ABQ9V0C3_SAGOE|nr:hypothetical protein P7K49_020495 [Saguinus oedipus]
MRRENEDKMSEAKRRPRERQKGPLWAEVWRRPARPPSARPRRLRSRRYRKLKRHMQLASPSQGRPRARPPAALPRDNEPLSRDSGRRWADVARSRKTGRGQAAVLLTCWKG